MSPVRIVLQASPPTTDRAARTTELGGDERPGDQDRVGLAEQDRRGSGAVDEAFREDAAGRTGAPSGRHHERPTADALPALGVTGSTISPVAESTPPQNDSG